ncbi:hypothetical protein [Gulbenkiania mobilis]|uniref:hypothetical protein n=1 Tax=Gulbenkiania mobilis TaxID=397457 RepID=UPI0006BBEE51|nr:hypothetical protein [Gulbenkiania mobilis]
MKYVLAIMASSLALAVAIPISTAGGGGATGGSTEVTQLLNNAQLLDVNMSTVSSLAEQIESKITLANQYVLQGQQYITQMKQLKNMVPEEIVQTYRDAVELKAKYDNLHGAVSDLYGDLQDAKASADVIFQDMSMKGLTPEQYLQKIRNNENRAKERVKGMLTNMSNSMKTVQTSYEQVRKFQAQIPASEGIHSSMQTMNSQMNALLAQNGQFLELHMKALEDTTEKNIQNIVDKEAEAAAREAFAQKQNEFAKAFKQVFFPKDAKP